MFASSTVTHRKEVKTKRKETAKFEFAPLENIKRSTN